MSQQHPDLGTLEEDQPPLNLYRVVAGGGLIALTMALLEKQLGVLSFLPGFFGLLGILGNWRAGPILLLLSLAVTVPIRATGFIPMDPQMNDFMNRLSPGELARAQRIDPIPDFLTCAALLTYLGAVFRLRGVENNLFPRDPRKSAPAKSRPLAKAPQQRSLESVQGPEVILFLAGVPIWTGLAALGLFFLVRASSRLVLFAQFLRAPLLFLWISGFTLAILAAVLAYTSVTEAEPAENRQFLQDQLWRETRREQGRVSRWLAWARLRAQRRKEKK